MTFENAIITRLFAVSVLKDTESSEDSVFASAPIGAFDPVGVLSAYMDSRTYPRAPRTKTATPRTVGVHVCKKCSKTSGDIVMAQTRGGDEGMTAFFVCADCGFRTKLRG